MKPAIFNLNQHYACPKKQTKTQSGKGSQPKYRICDKADEIALYYGFKPVRTPRLRGTAGEFSKIMREIENTREVENRQLGPLMCLREKIAFLQGFVGQNENIQEPPPMYYYRGSVRFGTERKKFPVKSTTGLKFSAPAKVWPKRLS